MFFGTSNQIIAENPCLQTEANFQQKFPAFNTILTSANIQNIIQFNVLNAFWYTLASKHSSSLSAARPGKNQKVFWYTFPFLFSLFFPSFKNTYTTCNVFTGSFCAGCGNRWTGETSCGRGGACNCGITWDCDVLCCCPCGCEYNHGRCPSDWKSSCNCAGERGCNCDGGRRIDCDSDGGVGGDSFRCAAPPHTAAKSNCLDNFRSAKSSVVSLFSIYASA